MPTAPEYANERGAPVVEAVACRVCHAPRGLRCVVRGQSLSGKVAPQIHLKRQLDYESVAPKRTTPRRHAPKPENNGSGPAIDDVLQVVREAWRDAVGREMVAEDFDALRAAAADGSPMQDSHDDSQPEDSHDDSQPQDSQSDDSHGDDSHGDDSQTKSADLLVNWLAVPVRWNDLDKKVYDHIVALQSDSKLQAVPLDQKELAALFKYGPRKVNESIAKLKSAGAINVKRQRGPSLYSASSEIPRWPVRIAGGIGTAPVDDSQPEDSHDDSQMPAGPVNPDLNVNHKGRPAGAPSVNNLSESVKPPDCELCGPGSMQTSGLLARRGIPDAWHCAGQDSTCSYVWAAGVGVVIQPGLQQLTDMGVLARMIREMGGLASGHERRRREPRTPYADAVREEMGKLPWEIRAKRGE